MPHRYVVHGSAAAVLVLAAVSTATPAATHPATAPSAVRAQQAPGQVPQPGAMTREQAIRLIDAALEATDIAVR